MSCDQIKKQIVAFYKDELANSTKREIENHLEKCAACRTAFESFQRTWQQLDDIAEEKPSEKLAEQFYTMLAGYQQGLRETQQEGSWLGFGRKSVAAKLAFQLSVAAMLLAAGFMLGIAVRSGSRGEVAQLAGELDDMRQMVMLSMLKQQSSADRLQAINYSSMVEPCEDIRAALQYTVETDPNTNVRLAALRALRPFAGDADTRQKIISSFSQQTSPLVQIEIIDFIRQTENPAELLHLLEQDEDVHNAVRQHIKWTIGTLKRDSL
ncbi:zf-HC2 domain-containing protein [candidate division KSB1 bacterium]|nr:zf-HC2 domain-containing protein [candidate division KSB1 bacterium]RQW05328.1 MAG: zf-HC2 domain-containing protein [candidate division KSB1 bacterium]